MIVATTSAGLFGPFTVATLGADRVYCDGAEIPFAVVGDCEVLDLETPAGVALENCELIGGKLVVKLPPDIPAEE